MQVAWSGAVSSTLDLEGGIINYVYGGNKGFVGSAAAGDVTLWPHRHSTDGFYICRMTRKAEV